MLYLIVTDAQRNIGELIDGLLDFDKLKSDDILE